MTVRRDDGFVDKHSPGIWFSESPWTSEQPLINYASGSILDVGCGAGRHLKHFQNAGFSVTGLDESKHAIDVCRERGCDKLISGDIFETSLENNFFDTVLLFGNNVGIGGSPAHTLTMLKQLRSSMKIGGRILVASLDVSITENPVHRAYHEARRTAHEPIGQITIRLEYDDEVGEWFDWYHPLPNELERLAYDAGLKVSKLISSGNGYYSAVLEPRTG